jgi:hypothetical protein
VKKILVRVLAVILTLTLLLTSGVSAAGGKNEVIPAQMVLDASLSEVSTNFGIPKANLEVARSQAFSFGADNFLLSSIVDKSSKQAYMVSTDAQGKVWIAEPKIEGELIDHMAQMKPDETVTVSIWVIYVSPEEELWQIPSKYPDVPFEGYRPAVGANVSPEVLAAVEANMTEIKLRAHAEAVQPIVDFLQSTESRIIYVSKYAPTVDAELSKEDIYRLARLSEVESISWPNEEFEPGLDTAAKTIDADDVWAEGYDGGGTDGTFGESKYYPYWYQTQVAVVDTGINFGHQALQHANGGTIQGGVAGDHGTEVAGCIASIDATFRGIAYGTELLDADYDPGSWENITEACDWAQNYLEYGNRADLYNFSSGANTSGGWNNDYCKYFDHIAYEWHKLPVTITHNDGLTTGWVRSPGNAFNVLTVGGIDDNDTETWADDAIANFSSWRNPVDGREKPEVCAPAVDITTTALGGDFTTVPGTSFAAPQVTGIVAQLLEQDQSMVYAPELTKAIIMATAIHNVVGNPRMDDKEGVGTVDASAAYQCVNEGNYALRWRPFADPFDIEFYALKGETVRFVINWLAHTDYDGSGYYGLCSDFDLSILAPGGSTCASSTSRVDPWEIVQFTAPSSGTYKAHVTAYRFDSDQEWVAAAWYGFPKEDFEWGTDGTSLGVEPPLGNVDWTVSASGGAYAQIDDDMSYFGTRSARFYGDCTNSASASYPRSPADYIRFYVMKDDGSCFYFDHGDTSTSIDIKITNAEVIQYCDIYYHTIPVDPPILAGRWYLLEFKNIDWGANTYDIYLDGSPIKTGATMRIWSPNNGFVRFTSGCPGAGSFWVDDVVSYGTVVEDFEWGNNGTSLDASRGKVDWDVYTSGTSVAKIDTVYKHTGTRSARFYRSSYNLYAYYPLYKPSFIGFYVRKDDTAYAEFRNGDGSNAIWVRINSAQQVQYYTGSQYNTVYTLPYSGIWYLIEFRNINWGTATYDIYVNGALKKSGAGMQHTSSYNGKVYYGSWTGSGTFWIDDITDFPHPPF